ncbi:HAD family phosphatase [Panacibacter ginsenosidivorans]|uniref:Beta-phosphoglucomutase n=1 Tax=Panacibacter ginsenosidivorans TaxID=1813871 RepID=A0A5B8VBD6_9BACT|nr:HAD family phosphatase [Panacibacter ginsenosidivorans]QEC67986.1 HAD family phosphatase [Panacibacter ginsenosidivorans]
MIKAFLFDLNGTMIDDMEYHAKAWSDILNNDLNAGLTYDEVKAQMYGKNDELLVRVFGENYFEPQKMQELSIEKERRYQSAYKPNLKLIRGLKEFLEEAKQQGIKLAIGSAAIPFNIDFVLDNLDIRNYFSAIVSADDVAVSKPDPETYLKCAKELGIDPAHCIVFEDAPKGVEAAANAGMNTVVITTMHGIDEFGQYENVVAFIDDYSNSSPSDFM